MKTLLVVMLLVICLPVLGGQKLYPISGGRSEPDPEDKKRIVLIAERPEDRRITFIHANKYEIKRPVFAVWVKVENLSDRPLTFAPSTFSAIDDKGEGYSGLDPKEAVKRVFDAHSGSQYAIAAVLAGPLAGPALSQAAERGVTDKVMRESLQPGDIPAHSFKEGMVFFEAPKKAKRITLKIMLGELWGEPFVLDTEKRK